MALRVAIALLAVGPALAQIRQPGFKYEATAIKRELNATSFYPLVHFAIPDGQCTGVLDSDVIPSWCLGLNGISLIVRDRLPPLLDIMDDLQSAVVHRQKDSYGVCVSTAAVKIKVSCQNLSEDVPESIRSAVSGQNWLEPAKKSSGPLLDSLDKQSGAKREENKASSTDKPVESFRRSHDLRPQPKNVQECLKSGNLRKPISPLQHKHFHFRNKHDLNLQESSRTKINPVQLRGSKHFNLHSNKGINHQNSVKNLRPLQTVLRGDYDSNLYPEKPDVIVDNPNRHYPSGLIPCKT